MMNIKKFLTEVREEVRKVTWPTREQNIRYTAIVILVSLLVGIYLGIVDWGFGNIITRILQK